MGLDHEPHKVDVQAAQAWAEVEARWAAEDKAKEEAEKGFSIPAASLEPGKPERLSAQRLEQGRMAR
ncbi:hypothetical protein HK097_009127 [Rhizophlyctis rosea]|uniref:Uncharacterized protein n=1 Tax=Rhizophlyctis rosea TaxID=64517 RepID=A0AAD5SCF6_9FUNG|nr:hypothetical protein HK097_009127 [Rhizophlyctis rosea]